MLEITVRSLVSVGVLDVLALFLNLWLLYTIKVRVPAFNAIDVLQVIKIVLVLLALLLSVWLEFLPCSSLSTLPSVKLCIASQEMSEGCFFHTICWTLVTIALVRKKVCECRGRAAVLITKRYGLKTWLLCLTPACIFAAVSLSLLIHAHPHIDDTEVNNSSSVIMLSDHVCKLSIRCSLTYTICQTLVLDFLPLIVLCVLYLKIYRDVRQTAQAANDLVQNRNRDPSKSIIRALIIHLSLTCSTWGIYTTARLITFGLGLNNLYLTIFKLVIFITHPFGEGLLQPSGKKPADLIHQRIHQRFNRQIHPNNEESISEFHTRNTSCMQANDRIPIGVVSPTDSGGRKISTYYTNPVYEKTRKQSEPVQNTGTPRGRKESREHLRKALKVLGDDQTSITQMRRLSTTLRFPIADFVDQDLYETYDTQNSPVLSTYRRLVESGSMYEGQTTSEVPNRKLNNKHHGDPDTPQRRWKRLYTTAKSVRKFSRAGLSRCALESFQEESDTQSVGETKHEVGYSKESDGTPTKHHGNRSRKSETFSKTTKKVYGMTPTKIKTSVSTRVELTGNKKMRSVSCINNEWVTQQRGDNSDQVHEMSNSETCNLQRSSCQTTSNILRSFSCDAKIYLKFQGQRPTESSHRGLGSRYSRYSRENVIIDEHATRKECIKKLLEMREYF